MTRLIWGEPDKRVYEFGVDRGVFYPKAGMGTAWNGLVSVNEESIDASQSLIYVDGVGHTNQLLIGEFAATVEAVTYPDEFEPYDGYSPMQTGQRRNAFDFSYRTMLPDGHYKIHLVYNAAATPSARNHASVNYKIDLELFSWKFTTRPELIPDARPSAHFVIDTSMVNSGVLSVIEDRIYGTDISAPSMPSVEDLLAIFEEFAVFRVTNHGDGTATVSGPDIAVHEVSPNLWELDWPSVIQVAEHTYHASSL